MADGYGNIYPDSANYIDNGNGYYDEKLEQTTRTDILKLMLYDLNSAISPRDARLIAIQAALEEFDHNDEALHDEELELRADHILLQKLTYAMSINMSSDEVGYITSALEAVYRGGRGRLAQSFHEICDALMPLFVEMIRPPNGWTPSKLAEQLSLQHQQQSLLGGSQQNSVRASSMIDNTDERSFAQSLASLGATSRASKDPSVQHDFQRSHGSIQQPTYYGDYDEESAESVEIPSGTGEYMEQMKRMSSTATGTSGRGDGDESTIGGVGIPPAGTEYFDEMNRRTSGGEYSTATGTESKVDSTGNDSALVIDRRPSSFGVETADSTGNGQALVPVTHELVSAGSVGSGPQVDIRNELEDAQAMLKRMSVAQSEGGEESLGSRRSPAVSHDSYEDFVAKEKEKMEGLRESNNSYDDFLENEKAKAESLGSAEDDGASFGSSAYSRRSSEPPPQDQGSYQASQEYEEEGYDDNKDERSAITGGSESSPPLHQEEDSQVPYNDDDTNRSSFRSEVNSEGVDEAPAIQPFDDDDEDQVPQDDYAEQPEEEVPTVEPYDDYTEEEEAGDQAPAIQPYDSKEEEGGYDNHAAREDEAPMVQPFDDEDDYEDNQEFDSRSEQEGSEDGAIPLRGGGDEIEDVTAQYATDSQYNPFSDPADYDDAQSGSGYNQGMTYPQKDEYSEYSGAGGGGYNEQGGGFPMGGDQSQASYGQGSGMDYNQEQQYERKFSQASGYGGDEDPARRMSVLSDDEWGGLEQSDRDPSSKGGQSYGDPSTMGGQSRDPSSIGQSLPPSKNPDDFMASMNEFVIEDEVTEAEEKYSDFPNEAGNKQKMNSPPIDNHEDIFQFQEHSKPRSEQDYFNYSDPVEGIVCSLAVRKVIKILRYFSRVLSAMEPLAQMNGLVDALLYHMTKKPLTTDYDDEIACRVDAIAVIVNLACAEENKIMLVYHPGLLDAVINIANHDPIDEAREHAAIVLMNLAYAEENKVHMVNQDHLLDTLVHLLSDVSPFTRRYASAALFTLACTYANTAVMARHCDGGILEALRKVLLNDPIDEARVNAAEALFNMARNNSDDTVENMGNHPRLLASLSHSVLTDYSADVRAYSARALEWLSADIHHPMQCHRVLLKSLTLASQWTKTTCIAEALKMQASFVDNRKSMVEHPGLLDALAALALLDGITDDECKACAISAIERLSKEASTRHIMVKNFGIMSALTKATFSTDQEDEASLLMRTALKNLSSTL